MNEELAAIVAEIDGIVDSWPETQNDLRLQQIWPTIRAALERLPQVEAALRELVDATEDWFGPAPETDPPKVVRFDAALDQAKTLLAQPAAEVE